MIEPTQLQMEFELERTACPSCGSLRHDGCGFAPDDVRPVMSITEALSATIEHAVEEHGHDGARERIEGLMWWGDSRMVERARAARGAS
jgi:hypothetical protein